MKIVLLDTGTMGSDIDFSSIESLGECIKYHNTQPEEVPERIKDADAVIINKVSSNVSAKASTFLSSSFITSIASALKHPFRCIVWSGSAQ